MSHAYGALARRCHKGARWGWIIAGIGALALLALGGGAGRLFGSMKYGVETLAVVEMVCSLYVIGLMTPHIRWSVRGQLRSYQDERQRIGELLKPVLDQSGLPMPRIVIVPVEACNAYAAGIWRRRATIGVTMGAIVRLTDDELQAVLAHEAAHLYHRDSLTMGWWAAFIGILTAATWACFAVGLMLMLEDHKKSSDDGSDGAAVGLFFMAIALVMGIVGMVLLTIGVRWDMRRRETLADDRALTWLSNPHALPQALRKLGGDPEVYAAPRALGFLYSVNPFPKDRWLARIWDTHPPLSDRIERLERLAASLMSNPSSAD